ncbi:MAG TPA: menaquinone biosynthesis protein [Pyrinomonadaceae bacterium]|nr:menaquinone biosynthesis protein [Pyrinomonadaceae bacterium]
MPRAVAWVSIRAGGLPPGTFPNLGIILITNEASPAPRLAASSYLNSAPLIWSYTRGSRRHRVELLTDAAPARCARMLARGEVEAALVPVIEYQRLPGVAVVPGVCVGARRAVRSVVLATRRADLRDVRRVALDESSRTSAALVRVILREFYGRDIETTTRSPDVRAMLDAADAALVIGDPAMTFGREGLYVHDLASLWREHTGLGFVFAMWMAHEAAAGAVCAADFAGARDEGVAHLEEIIDEYERRLPLPREELRAYLTENVCFELDGEMRAGLELYFRLAHKHGLIEKARPLHLFDV